MRVLTRERNGIGPGLRGALVVIVAILAGLSITRAPAVDAAIWIAAVPVLVVVGFLIARGPRWCLVALIGLSVLGVYQNSFSAGALDLRITDLFFAALVGWFVAVRITDGPQFGRDVGQRWIAVFLFALAVSLYPLAVQAPGDFQQSFIAWLRLAETVSLIWLIPYAVRKLDDFDFVLRAIAAFTTLEIVRAVIDGFLSDSLGDRLQGANGPNPTGLLAALTIVMALHSPVPRRSFRVIMFATGVVGLVLAQSLGAIAATAGTLAIFGLVRSRGGKATRGRGLLVPARIILLIVAALAVAASLRPQNLPDSPEFRRSTTQHRVILATAGWELFVANPVAGFGWQRADTGDSVAEINRRLERRFRDVNPAFFLPQDEIVGVHNAYMQVLAQAGLIGFTALVVMGAAVFRRFRAILANTGGDPYERARCATILLVVILVWWNDSGLYGGQPETVLAATFVGLLAALPVTLSGPTPARSEAALRKL